MRFNLIFLFSLIYVKAHAYIDETASIDGMEDNATVFMREIPARMFKRVWHNWTKWISIHLDILEAVVVNICMKKSFNNTFSVFFFILFFLFKITYYLLFCKPRNKYIKFAENWFTYVPNIYVTFDFIVKSPTAIYDNRDMISGTDLKHLYNFDW